MISVQNLTKSFGTAKAVSDLSFEVKTGEVVGFLGPNGAGKSTTMRMMCGYLSPDIGEVVIDGVPVAEDVTQIQGKIGYLPENNPLYKDMLVADLLEFSAEARGIPKNKRLSAFDFAVSASGIAEVYFRLIRELSKGYRQRVGIALALLHQPDIIIMDEPTEGLDPNQRSEIRSLIRQLAQDRTIIVSTHVMQEAIAVCSRLLVINHGQLAADGTPDELTRRAQGARVIAAEFEGTGIEAALAAVPELTKVEVESLAGSRHRVRIEVTGDIDVYALLSHLIHEHRWEVRKLAEEERSLEDVFHELTGKSL